MLFKRERIERAAEVSGAGRHVDADRRRDRQHEPKSLVPLSLALESRRLIKSVAEKFTHNFPTIHQSHPLLKV